MKFPQLLKILALVLVITAGAFTSAFAQAQGAQNTENVLVNSLVIPMDNTNQGPAATGAFNLRAYGLVNRLLQNNIPVKWAIKFNKATKDTTDFTATVTRVAGNDGVGSGSVNFAGGPFIVAPEYAALALAQVTAFNNLVGGTTDDVTVYQVTTQSVADIRYTVVHKPKIAVGPDGGNFGTGVDQAVFAEAGIPTTDYTSVPDDLVNSSSCFTLAVQAHSTSSAFVKNYQNFVSNGGNLLLQCASINTFENNPFSGHFQVTNNYTVWGTNDNTDVTGGTLQYPNAGMPFNQFIGDINGDQDGAITDYINPTGSNFTNGNLISVRNSGGTTHNGSVANAYIATVSDLLPTVPGGNVFELGGHDYNRGQGNANLGNLNGKRMILNTIFVPVTRPCSNLSVPSVEGYKSVALGPTGPNGDVNGNGQLDSGDTVIWTVTYINRGLAPASNFQIADVIPTTPAPGFTLNTAVGTTVTVTALGTSGLTVATRNVGYTGAGNNNLLNAGGVLDANGKITITIPTKLGPAAPAGIWANQSSATGTNVSGNVLSDDIDQNHPVTYPGGNINPPANSVHQIILPTIDPTLVSTFRVTAAQASVTGRVLTPAGYGLSHAQVSIVNPATGASKSVFTNPFGFFTITGIDVGQLYSVAASAKGYEFLDAHSFVVNDDVAGLVFTASYPADVKDPIDTPVKTGLPPAKSDPAPALKTLTKGSTRIAY
ncbi:MAG: carboxypeptidase-like regulatory domain-containing protein [Acidobacteriota bacterium]